MNSTPERYSPVEFSSDLITPLNIDNPDISKPIARKATVSFANDDTVIEFTPEPSRTRSNSSVTPIEKTEENTPTSTSPLVRQRLYSQTLTMVHRKIFGESEVENPYHVPRKFSSSNIFTSSSLPRIPIFGLRLLVFLLNLVCWYRTAICILILSNTQINEYKTYVMIDIWFSIIHMMVEMYRYIMCYSDVGLFWNKYHLRNVCGVRTISMFTAKSKQTVLEFLLFNLYLNYSDVIRMYFLNLEIVKSLNEPLYWNVFASTATIRALSIFINYCLQNRNLYSITIGWNPMYVINKNKDAVVEFDAELDLELP